MKIKFFYCLTVLAVFFAACGKCECDDNSQRRSITYPAVGLNGANILSDEVTSVQRSPGDNLFGIV